MSTSLAAAGTDTTGDHTAVKLNVSRGAANDEHRYVFTRFLLLRLLGLVYATAFLILVEPQDALIGDGGILTAARYLSRVESVVGSRADALVVLPTLFWVDASDGARHVSAWTGLALSLAVLLGV